MRRSVEALAANLFGSKLEFLGCPRGSAFARWGFGLSVLDVSLGVWFSGGVRDSVGSG